jgi:hypothetical protein
MAKLSSLHKPLYNHLTLLILSNALAGKIPTELGRGCKTSPPSDAHHSETQLLK